jgi:hypothetical protein
MHDSAEALSPFAPGALVILYLREPREKVWGVLTGLDTAGVSVRGVDLESFGDWLRGLSESAEERVSPSSVFYPLRRVEKILMDEEASGIPSYSRQCIARTGEVPERLLARGAA